MAVDETKVLIVGFPQLLRELLEQAFAERPGYRLVPADDGLERLAETVDAERPHYVVVPLEHGALPRACTEFLEERAGPAVVGVEQTRGGSRLVRLRPTVHELADVAPSELVERIEEVVAEAAP